MAPEEPEVRWNVLRRARCPLWVVLVLTTLRTRKTEGECMRSSSDETARLSAIRQRHSGAYGGGRSLMSMELCATPCQQVSKNLVARQSSRPCTTYSGTALSSFGSAGVCRLSIGRTVAFNTAQPSLLQPEADSQGVEKIRNEAY